jgi:hypothetical protein
VSSLLYEGYALYPYTPGAAKNATPTPFGIVYPPAYAAREPTTHDHARIQCRLDGDGRVTAEIRFLQSSGERHEAVERRAGPGAFDFEGLTGEVHLDVDARVVTCSVHNTTPIEDPDVPRARALERAMLSTHIVLRVEGARFLSPLEWGGDHHNSYPVLATPDDDAVLGAAIMLPDHPEIAPESRGNLFDNTEIEEALLLHVQTLSDAEREDIAQQDPAVKAMIERAMAATPEDMKRLHGRITLKDPRDGDEEVVAGGVTWRRGGHVVLRPDPDRDPYDRMLEGREATIERIYSALDGTVHLACSIDDDPAPDLMRESGRFHFFKPDEVEAL